MKSGIVLARQESPRTQQSFVSTRSACHPISVSARRIVQCSKGFRVLRKASARLPQLRHTRGSARPAKSHKEEERKQHFQADAEARRAPGKNHKALDASPKGIQHPRLVTQLPRSFRSVEHPQPAKILSVGKDGWSLVLQSSQSGQTPVPHRKSSGSRLPPHTPARSPCKNGRDKTCADDFRCGTLIPRDRCTASHPAAKTRR